TPINLGNLIWNDLDADGEQDMGEPGIASVTVQLWNVSKTLLIDTTTTNASGIYSLTAPLPGSYRIRVLLPAPGSTFAPKNQAGGDDTKDSDINTLGLNMGFTDAIVIGTNVISITNLDAGIVVSPLLPVPAPIDLGLLTPTPSSTPIRAAVPTPPATSAAPEAGPNCTSLRLTAPLDGLPDGVTTFYWDPLSLPGVTYTITVFDEGGAALASFGAGSGTSVSGNVS